MTPEVWVDVSEDRVAAPAARSDDSPAAGGRLPAVAASVALAGWTAAEIHRGLNESELSTTTRSVLDA